MRRFLRFALVAALILVPCAALAYHVRLVTSAGVGLFWASPSNVSVVIGSDGPPGLTDGSHETAMRMAIEDWSSVAGSTVELVEDASPASQARTDWEATDIHLLLFDDLDDSGYFGGNSGTVALTPIWYTSGGAIQDADVLFNSNDHDFTTSAQPGRFDVRDVAAHELGHLLGLNHTGWAGGTMYPYVDPTVILHRSLSEDEERGMRDAYPPAIPATGRLTGTVVRASDSTPVAGAHVVATDADGRTAASNLTSSAGAFTLNGLDPGTYTVYAAPLDTPVSVLNLGASYDVDVDFEPAFYAGTTTIVATETVALGQLAVEADVTLSLGEPTDAFPVRVVDGASRMVTLHGEGLTGVTLASSDPGVVISSPVGTASQVTFQVTVDDGEPPGHVDILATGVTGDRAVLTGALEVTPPVPMVTDVVPGQGPQAGGTALTVTGSEFHAGARVVIGGQIYRDGIGGTSVVDVNTITLTTAATGSGAHDVVVIDPTGVEGRKADAFVVPSNPALARVFPRAGNVAGGTEVVLVGDDFLDGLTVRIDGIDQPSAVRESATLVRFTTIAGAGGPHEVEVENPDGGIATFAAGFAYVAQADPTLAGIAPDAGVSGTTLTLTGTNFTPDLVVGFVADPSQEPVWATSMTFVDASTLEVVAPTNPPGPVIVLVTAPNEQGAFLEGAFTFLPSGGGGGGCHTVPVSGPGGPRQILEGTWWLAALLAWLAWSARGARRARPAGAGA